MEVKVGDRRIVAAWIFMLAAAALTGCASDNPAAPPAAAPPTASSKLGTIEANVTYCTGAGVPQRLDIYYPTQAPAGLFPVVVYIHGGQFFKGNKSAQPGTPPDMWRQTLTPQGFAFVSIEYRLGPDYKFPAMLEDAKCAIRFLRANAATYNINADRIGVTGTSSGGFLAALIALSNTNVLEGTGGYPGVSSRVRAAVIEYGADMNLLQPPYSQAEADERTAAIPVPPPAGLLVTGSAITHVSPDDPPFLILHGEQDNATDKQDSIDLYNALRAAGVTATLQLVANAGHGWDTVTPFGPINPSWPQILQLELNFFNTYLKN